MRAFLLIFLLSAFISAYAQDSMQVITVESVGYGSNKDEAYEDAIRNAVAEAVGVLVESKTIVSKGELIEDEILTRSVGYLTSVNLLIDYDETQGMLKIRADVNKDGVESAIQSLKPSEDGSSAAVDGQSAYAAAVSRRLVFDKAIADSRARTDAIFLDLIRAISIQASDITIDTRAVNNQVKYALSFSQNINPVRYNAAIRKLDELFIELWAEKAPYEGGEIPLNGIVLTNIDNSSMLYTFDYEYDGMAALDAVDSLFLKIHAMNGRNSFAIIVMNGDKQVIDASKQVQNNNSYFMLDGARVLSPAFAGEAQYTHEDRIDLVHLRDFESLNIINAIPSADMDAELLALSPMQLGMMFLKGGIFKVNKAEAAYWYLKDVMRAAPADPAPGFAPYAIGLYFYSGKDQAGAVEWWFKAAELGYADAQYNLGYAYHRGEGVERNYDEAAKWYTLAATQGHKTAQQMLERLNAS
ncbi:MAG: sel1 repeat family protein [Deferribacteraceae bacterium]|jgi:hypothetical protein|nr:sel1 repeat family protein [Deferribacteraceae bacterium]